MSNDDFWNEFWLLFYERGKVEEFAEITGLSVDRLKAKRREYLQRYMLKMSPRISITAMAQ